MNIGVHDVFLRAVSNKFDKGLFYCFLPVDLSL